jgi:hypothetical protein
MKATDDREQNSKTVHHYSDDAISGKDEVVHTNKYGRARMTYGRT